MVSKVLKAKLGTIVDHSIKDNVFSIFFVDNRLSINIRGCESDLSLLCFVCGSTSRFIGKEILRNCQSSDYKKYMFIDVVFLFLSGKVCGPLKQIFYAVYHQINNNSDQGEM
jgi:hypothetical protein